MPSNSLIRSLIVPLLILLQVACSSQKADVPDHYFRTFKENGVTIAETGGIPRYEGNIFEFVEVLELLEDERYESLLNRPTDFLMDSEGRFHVADSGDSRIAVFDQQGRFLFSYGREGEGPGEFQTPRLQSLRDDVISIYDMTSRRETRFNTDGELLDITSLPIEHQHRPEAFFTLEEGLMVQIIHQMETIGNDGYSWEDILVHNAAGDTVALVSTDHVLTSYQYQAVFYGRQTTRRGQYPFTGSTLAIYSPLHGFVLSDGKRPLIDIYDTDGTYKRSIRVDLPPSPVTSDDRTAVEAMYRSELENAEGQIKESIQVQINNLRFLDLKSPWLAFLVDDQGWFWILDEDFLSLPEITRTGVDIMVLSPEGEYLGRTRLPPATFLQFSQGRLLANNRDPETGEFRLTVYEIRSLVGDLDYP